MSSRKRDQFCPETLIFGYGIFRRVLALLLQHKQANWFSQPTIMSAKSGRNKWLEPDSVMSAENLAQNTLKSSCPLVPIEWVSIRWHMGMFRYLFYIIRLFFRALILGNNDDSFHFIPLRIPGRFQFLILYIIICLSWLLFFCIG